MFEYKSGVFSDADRKIRINFQSTNDPMADNCITGIGFYEDNIRSIRFDFDSARFGFAENEPLSCGRAGSFIYLFFDQILELYLEGCLRHGILDTSKDVSDQLQGNLRSAFDLFSELSRRAEPEKIFRLFFLNSSGFFKKDNIRILSGTNIKFHRINFEALKNRFEEDLKETVSGLKS